MNRNRVNRSNQALWL